MAICEQLLKFGLNVDLGCSLCNNAVESMEHLFFACPYSAEVWNQVAQWCNIDKPAVGWTEMRRCIEDHCKSQTQKQRMFRLLVTVAIYQIWKERNQRKFQAKSCATSVAVKECQFMMAVCSHRDKKLARMLKS